MLSRTMVIFVNVTIVVCIRKMRYGNSIYTYTYCIQYVETYFFSKNIKNVYVSYKKFDFTECLNKIFFLAKHPLLIVGITNRVLPIIREL